MAATRGIRNNNPLNIRKGNNWQGERHPQADKEFEEFQSMIMGLRAGIKLVRNYIDGKTSWGRPCQSIDALVTRWAPPSENNTQAYIKAVSEATGIHPLQRIYSNNRDMVCRIVQAMAKQETGSTIDMQLIRSAWDLL